MWQQPGECGSLIATGGVFTLQKDILDCDCDAFGYALQVDGQGTVLNLNGYTVGCKPGAGAGSLSFIIKVLGKANTVMGPGTREYDYKKLPFRIDQYYILIYLIIISLYLLLS